MPLYNRQNWRLSVHIRRRVKMISYKTCRQHVQPTFANLGILCNHNTVDPIHPNILQISHDLHLYTCCAGSTHTNSWIDWPPGLSFIIGQSPLILQYPCSLSHYYSLFFTLTVHDMQTPANTHQGQVNHAWYLLPRSVDVVISPSSPIAFSRAVHNTQTLANTHRAKSISHPGLSSACAAVFGDTSWVWAIEACYTLCVLFATLSLVSL
jgi:hypothetical protein